MISTDNKLSFAQDQPKEFISDFRFKSKLITGASRPGLMFLMMFMITFIQFYSQISTFYIKFKGTKKLYKE